MNTIFCLTGASGVGKSTVLDFIKNNYNILVKEVSARPYLPKDMDYVNGLNEQNQTIITQHRFTDILQGLNEDVPVVFSRSPVDSLAYESVLNKAPYLVPLLSKQIRVTQAFIHYIYIPVEFEMKDGNDVIRGTNREVQLDTDTAIFQTMENYDIDYLELSGSIEEREIKLINYFRKYGIFCPHR